MRIPFDSLDCSNWFAWSDWSREQGRERAAGWGAKVGAALQKMSVVGCDPRMVLGMTTRVIRQGTPFYGEVLVKQILFLDRDWLTVIRREAEDECLFNTARWLTFKKATRDNKVARRLGAEMLASPQSFSDPWKYHRLSAKFYQSVVVRARGINSARVQGVGGTEEG